MKSYLTILEKLVSFNTINNPVKKIKPSKDILIFIRNYLSEYGYENVMYVKEGYWTLISYIKRDSPKMLYLGHCDVVPPGPNWETDPFTFIIRDEKGYGRGSADMKGSVAVMLSLAEFFAKEEKGTIIFAFNLDEESGGAFGAGELLPQLEKHDLVPDYVVNGDANGLQIINRRRNPYIINLKIPKKKKTVKGKLYTEKFTTEIAGNRTMHAAYFNKELDIHCAVAASKKLSEDDLVQTISGVFIKNNVIPPEITIDYVKINEEGEAFEIDKNLTLFLRSIRDFDNVDIESDYSDYGINLTFNYFIEKEGHYFVQLDLRIMSNNHTLIQKYFEDFFKDHNVEAEIKAEGSIGPVNTSESSILVQKALEVAKELELPTKTIEMGGATDSRWFSARNIPAIEFGGIGGNVHGANEYIELKSLQTVQDFYKRLYVKLTELDE
ncbi:MAG: M20/M25/M40 family metallo-hydrolase [Candidatus Heimdallarchaeum aukensis]|uniref:M20/M25/M40 family metallo-hydrolase n=1 Tax=Candidatus Heimdallarchaeum aukensis TaxID=2876573 RepID=A0A9Y1BJR1_9ARCH|nr:MAG: M20/M25/M40 family metallo-hydrolase [Candidatus Heimdallarchaeum aukensis]